MTPEERARAIVSDYFARSGACAEGDLEEVALHHIRAAVEAQRDKAFAGCEQVVVDYAENARIRATRATYHDERLRASYCATAAYDLLAAIRARKERHA